MFKPTGPILNRCLARFYPGVDNLYTIEASKINAKHFGIPMRPEVPSPPGAKPINEIKVIRPTVAEVDKGIPEVIEQWRDTFGN